MTVLFGGYSYGSLIVTQLPEVNALLQHFKDPIHEGSAIEIVLRAQHLATQTDESYDQRLAQRGRPQRPPSGHRKSTSHHSVIYGGEEMASPTARNPSGGSRHSHDLPHRIKNHIIHRHSSKSISVRRSGSQGTQLDVSLPEVKALYILISPLLPPLSAFLSSSVSSLLMRAPEPSILLQNPTLVVYGSGDGFTSARRMNAWCRKMEARANVDTFKAYEQEGAGHFWRERGALNSLTGVIEEWITNHLEQALSERD